MKKRYLILLSVSIVALLFGLVFWWGILILKLGGDHFKRMIYWEGGTILISITLLFIVLIIFYFKDIIKAKLLHSFFASLSHDLKTPISTISLHLDEVASKNKEHVDRIKEELKVVDLQIDKILQLARIEINTPKKLAPIKLSEYIEEYLDERPWIKCDVIIKSRNKILADEASLKIIFDNLFDNTYKYSKKPISKIEIKGDKKITLTYSDSGILKIRTNQLGKVFNKSKDSTGKGIGLYLVKKMAERMHGKCKFVSNKTFKIILTFKRI